MENETTPRDNDSRQNATPEVDNGSLEQINGWDNHGKSKVSRISGLAMMITCLLRIIVGGVFIFSGFVKAIDPWGTLYKVDAYLAAMSLDIWPNLKLVGVFALCATEFVTGVFLLLGCFRKSISVIGLCIMAFMLPLSLWVAVSNPVDDCGCFGDALHISNWATFIKNIVLVLALVWLLKYNRKLHWVITPALQWIASITTCAFIVAIELFGYIAQPLIDFRPYRLGEPLVDSESIVSADPEFVFIYEKDGVRKEFGENDQLPDEADGWTFVDRKEIESRNAGVVKDSDGRDFRIWDKEGESDMTEEALIFKGKELLIMIPDLKGVSPAVTWKINSLYEWATKNDVTMVGVVSGSERDIADWEDLSMASYPIYTAEDTQIKEVVRGNPGVVYLVDGNVEWKSSLYAINIDDFMQPGTSTDAMSFATDNYRTLRNCLYIYLTTLAVLILLSFSPNIRRQFLSAGH